MLGEAVGDVQKAEIRARRGVVELRQVTVGRLQPVGRIACAAWKVPLLSMRVTAVKGPSNIRPKTVGAAPARKPRISAVSAVAIGATPAPAGIHRHAFFDRRACISGQHRLKRIEWQ